VARPGTWPGRSLTLDESASTRVVRVPRARGHPTPPYARADHPVIVKILHRFRVAPNTFTHNVCGNLGAAYLDGNRRATPGDRRSAVTGDGSGTHAVPDPGSARAVKCRRPPTGIQFRKEGSRFSRNGTRSEGPNVSGRRVFPSRNGPAASERTTRVPCIGPATRSLAFLARPAYNSAYPWSTECVLVDGRPSA
jgi:hypothetical protein